MQAVTIFFPIYEAYALYQQPRDDPTHLHGRRDSTMTFSSSATSPSYNSPSGNKHTIPVNTSTTRLTEMPPMTALEWVLATNPLPLLDFTGKKDFTVENIIFLLEVRAWRARWATGPETPRLRALLFEQATKIYVRSVSVDFAEFPINIKSESRSQLDTVFGKTAARMTSTGNRSINIIGNEVLCHTENHSTLLPLKLRIPMSRFTGGNFLPSQWDELNNGEYTDDSLNSKTVRLGVREVFTLPPNPIFNSQIFDAAEETIKHLVLAITWRKFVNAVNGTDPWALGETLI
jgi:hypothetical protein